MVGDVLCHTVSPLLGWSRMPLLQCDKVVFKRMAGWLAEAIPGSQARIVENAGHMVHHTAAEQVAAAVEGVATLAP